MEEFKGIDSPFSVVIPIKIGVLDKSIFSLFNFEFITIENDWYENNSYIEYPQYNNPRKIAIILNIFVIFDEKCWDFLNLSNIGTLKISILFKKLFFSINI